MRGGEPVDRRVQTTATKMGIALRAQAVESGIRVQSPKSDDRM